MKNIYIYLFDGFSDWELSYLTPEINKDANFNLCFFSDDGQSVKSMGGLQISPTHGLAEVKTSEVEMLILPGGTAWEKGEITSIHDLVHDLNQNKKSIAAICAATNYLANLGFLDKIEHTGNDLNYLKAVAPNYKGEQFYQQKLAVSSNNIITASGIAPIEFAKEVFTKIELFPAEQIEAWYNLFKHGIWNG